MLDKDELLLIKKALQEYLASPDCGNDDYRLATQTILDRIDDVIQSFVEE